MSTIDETHDPRRESWVASARGHAEFPIQNLPLGVFSPAGGPARGGVAIGNQIFDLRAGLEAGLFAGEAATAAEAAAGRILNPLMALDKGSRLALRRSLSVLLSAGNPERAKIEPLASRLLHNAADCKLHLPALIRSFTDFFAGIHHARNGGMRRDPNNPLNLNYKYVPVAYHSRASSVRPSEVPIRRPNGQRKAPDEGTPSFGPSQKLDYELELAVWIGPGNGLGEPIPIAEAADHVFGLGLLNDWSARDVQSWESQPLGPFLGKNFGTTVSPWVITPEALAPFDIALEALLLTEGLRAKGLPPHRMSASNTTDLYWTIAQLVTHHTCGGCDLIPGDLFGTGTISGPTREGYGSLMELSADGQRQTVLASEETRTFVENGDEVIFRAHCRKTGFVSIGFGECRARII